MLFYMSTFAYGYKHESGAINNALTVLMLLAKGVRKLLPDKHDVVKRYQRASFKWDT